MPKTVAQVRFWFDLRYARGCHKDAVIALKRRGNYIWSIVL